MFLHISDLHYLRDPAGAPGAFRGVFEQMTPPLVQLDGLCAGLRKKPGFILISGDLCHEGNAADYAALREGLQMRFPGVPLYAIPGNHDLPEAYRRGWGDEKGRVHTVRHHDLSLLFLDNTDPGRPDGLVRDGDLDELETALAQAPRPAILVMHHHLIKEQFALPPAAFPARLVRIVSGSGLAAILTGHTHHLFRGVFAGVPCHTVGSLCFRGLNRAGDVLFEEASAIHRCRLTGGSLDVTPIESPGPPRPLYVCKASALGQGSA